MSILSEAEERALERLRTEGAFLISSIPERSTKDVFGRIDPGMNVYKKLEKKGLLYFTEEESFELEPGLWFTFTPEVYLITGS